MDTRRKLYEWRAQTAEREGVELFRVLPSATLEAIVTRWPKSREELMEVKGIKEAKANRYGDQILAILAGMPETHRESQDHAPDLLSGADTASVSADTLTYSVGAFLDVLNHDIGRYEARVVGEIGKDLTQRGNYVYFSLRDKTEAVMNVSVPLLVQTLAGFTLEEGMEIAVTGRANIWKPYGRLSFRVDVMELVGEGALKKAYDELRKRLTGEGLFSDEKKRAIPEYPETIGLLTSMTGAVIHDFQTNLGRYGFKVECIDVRVEGAQSAPDILKGIASMRKRAIDVLVIIRGGGSFESLQAFNNELIVRAIADFPVPVIAGIGHDKDVPLACLAADAAPSTPTACAVLLNQSWEDAHILLSTMWPTLEEYVRSRMQDIDAELSDSLTTLEGIVKRTENVVRETEQMFAMTLQHLSAGVATTRGYFRESMGQLLSLYRTVAGSVEERLVTAERSLAVLDPRVQLKRGYSIVRHGGKILRSLEQVGVGEEIAAELSDGTIVATVKRKLP